MNTKQKALLIASLTILLAGATFGQQPTKPRATQTRACYSAQAFATGTPQDLLNILYKLEARNSVSNPDFAALVEVHITTLQADTVNIIATCEIKDSDKALKHFLTSGKKFVTDSQKANASIKEAAGL